MLKKRYTREFYTLIIKIDEHIRTMIPRHRLVVENIGVEDDGLYTISASNSVGDTVATAKLVCHSKKTC